MGCSSSRGVSPSPRTVLLESSRSQNTTLREGAKYFDDSIIFRNKNFRHHVILSLSIQLFITIFLFADVEIRPKNTRNSDLGWLKSVTGRRRRELTLWENSFEFQLATDYRGASKPKNEFERMKKLRVSMQANKYHLFRTRTGPIHWNT